MSASYPPQGVAPVISGGDFLPPAAGFDLGSTSFPWAELHVTTIVFGGTVTGDWNPSADDTYDLGDGATPLEWKDLYLDGVAYIDTLQVHVAASILGADGLDFTPGSDTDVDLLTVGVSGTPKLWWDESEDYFVFTKGVVTNVELGCNGIANTGDVYMNSDGQSIFAPRTASGSLIFKAYTGATSVEVGRIEGASTPYWSFGASQENKFYNDGKMTFGTLGDGTGISTGTTGDVLGFFPEVPTGTTISDTARGLRVRFLINAAQTADCSLYAIQGQLRLKANLADGSHAGLFGYVEQSGTVVLSSPGFNSAVSAAVETASTFTLNSGATLAGVLISSNAHDSGTFNGNYDAIHIRKATGCEIWQTGLTITDSAATTGIDIGSATTGIDFTGTVTKAINFANATVTVDAGRDNAFWSIGTYGSPVTISVSDNFLAAQINLVNDAEVLAAAKKLDCLYLNATTGADQGTYGRLKGLESYIVIEHALLDAHAIYGEVYYNDSVTGITNEGLGVGGTVDTTGCSSAPAGLLYGGKFRIKGTLDTTTYKHMALFVVSESSTHSTMVIENLSGATVTNMLWLKNDEAVTNGILISGGTITNDIQFQNASTIADGASGLIFQATAGMTIGLAASAPNPDQGGLHVWKGTAGTAEAPAGTVLALENSGDTSFTWLFPDATSAYLRFHSVTEGRRGFIQYNASAAPEMRFGVNNTLQFYLKDGVFEFQKAMALQFVTASVLRGSTTEDHYYDLQAYDVNGTAYASAIRIQNANNVAAPIEIGFFGATPVYRQAAITDVTVTGVYGDDDNAIETAINSLIGVLESFGLVAT